MSVFSVFPCSLLPSHSTPFLQPFPSWFLRSFPTLFSSPPLFLQFFLSPPRSLLTPFLRRLPNPSPLLLFPYASPFSVTHLILYLFLLFSLLSYSCFSSLPLILAFFPTHHTPFLQPLPPPSSSSCLLPPSSVCHRHNSGMKSGLYIQFAENEKWLHRT